MLQFLDPSGTALNVLCVLLLFYASGRASKENFSVLIVDAGFELNYCHVISFPVLGSLMLLVMFYYFQYLQLVYMFLSVALSVMATINLFLPPLDTLAEYIQRTRRWLSLVMYMRLLAISLSVIIVSAWIFTNHWVYFDITGVAICVLMLEFVRLPNLKIATSLLLFLIVYDVFWVFCSSLLFEQNVMVEVATKQLDNPVGILAKRLDFPAFADDRPSISIPGKLLFPSFSEDRFVLLGLGDIVLPGLLLSLAMRCDKFIRKDGMEDTSARCWKRMTLHSISSMGYFIGLNLAQIASNVYDAPQPALLYLVPCTLLPFVVKAYSEEHLAAIWSGRIFELKSRTHKHISV